jgi:hypothetical protein
MVYRKIDGWALQKKGMPPTYFVSLQPDYYHDPRFIQVFLIGVITGITLTRILS